MTPRVRSFLQPGWILWARHYRLLQNALVGIGAAALIRTAVHLLLEVNGGIVEVGALWVSIVGALPLVFVFSHDTPNDICSSRSLAARRLLLVAATVAIGLVIAVVTYPTNVDEFGTIAVFRNILTFIGLGLLSLFLLGPSWVWALPLAAAASSMLFAWPQYPTIWHTIYGMLRSPGVWRYPEGTIDASIPLALAIFVTSSVSYIAGMGSTAGRKNAISNVSFTRHSGSGLTIAELIARGWKRSTFFSPALFITTACVAVSLLSDLGSWAGSPRLVGQSMEEGMFLFGGLALLVGVLMGQARWRTGVAVWENLSDLPHRSLVVKPMLYAATALAIPSALISAIALLVNTVFLFHNGVASFVVAKELLDAANSAALASIAMAVLAAVGAYIGFLRKGFWVPPLMFIVGIAGTLSIFSQLDTPKIDHRAEMTSCIPIPELTSRLCSTPANAPFLNATANTLSQLYQQSPVNGYLPSSIYLVDNATARSDAPMAKIGLYTKRTLFIPDNLAANQIPSQLAGTIINSCKEISPEAIFHLTSTNYDEAWKNTTTSNKDMEKIQQCLTGSSRFRVR